MTTNSVSNPIGVVEGNVISGNDHDGVYIKSKSDFNTLAGNFIGTTAAGSAAIGNGNDGIKIEKSYGNLIGDDDTTFALSNVISGNGANGITLHKASGNRIAMNYIGTDAAGTVDLGNAQNGILVRSKSADNLIGGEATGGNDPTNNVFVRPPQGNLISGNDANGVLINGRSTGNQLSGNFIGTRASGNAALGNGLDGVAIEKADGNSLIGCTVPGRTVRVLQRDQRQRRQRAAREQCRRHDHPGELLRHRGGQHQRRGQRRERRGGRGLVDANGDGRADPAGQRRGAPTT